jgi:hypothetical protein
MNIFLDEHLSFLTDLVKEEVSFILVGGYAVIYHGYVRATGDMDIWLKPDNANKEKLLRVLEKHGIAEGSIKKVKKLDFKEMVAFHFGYPPNKIDFLTKMTGINFEDSYLHTEKLKLKDCEIPVLKLNDLIVNKLLSSRTKDKADVEELQKIQKIIKKARRH